MQRYIGLDVHARSCTLAVVGESGKRLRSQVVDTAANPLISFIKSVAGRTHVCLEEGTQSAWIYEVLKPHVDSIIVTHQSESKGPMRSKDDLRDAFALAEALRLGSVTAVYKEQKGFGTLKSLVEVYTMTSRDTVRVQNRIKALFRSRGVDTSGKTIYMLKHRDSFLDKLPKAYRASGQVLFEQYDAMRNSNKQAKQLMEQQLSRHAISRVIATCPGFGEVRVAQFLVTVISPYRFCSKRKFWSYCGLGIVMRSSSDWVQERGCWQRSEVVQTRGLNRDFNRTLKSIFKGAATTVIDTKQRPLYDVYQSLLSNGTKPPLAKLTIARKIAAIALVLWKKKEKYDPAYETEKG